MSSWWFLPMRGRWWVARWLWSVWEGSWRVGWCLRRGEMCKQTWRDCKRLFWRDWDPREEVGPCPSGRQDSVRRDASKAHLSRPTRSPCSRIPPRGPCPPPRPRRGPLVGVGAPCGRGSRWPLPPSGARDSRERYTDKLSISDGRERKEDVN